MLEVTQSAASLAARVKPLPDALAHAYMREKPDSLKMVTLNALFARLSPRDQVLCRMEICKCKEAKRAALFPTFDDTGRVATATANVIPITRELDREAMCLFEER